MTFLRALATLLRLPGFRRLFKARLTSQGSDGLFQVALASHVLFDPQQAADAQGVAAAFAVVLLPYSALGPFVGVLLDRWPRRRVLVISQLVRAASMLVVAGLVASASTGPVFFAVVLVVFSVNRFVLAGLSAALPHVVTRDLHPRRDGRLRDRFPEDHSNHTALGPPKTDESARVVDAEMHEGTTRALRDLWMA